MLKNWTNIFIYHIRNNKFFTILNILGLSIGIAGLIFAILYWNDEHSYDQWNPEKDKIFIVMNDFGGGNIWTTNSPVTGRTLNATTNYLDKYCYFRINYTAETIQYKGKIELVDKIFSAERNFFSFFPFEFVQGNIKTALHDRNSMALSEEAAAKIFKNENPMGKQVKYADKIFVVRGVYKMPKKSSVMPAVITPIVEDELETDKDNWGFSYGLMFKLKRPSDTTAVIRNLDHIFLEKNYKQQAKEVGLSLDEFIKQYGDPIKARLVSLSKSRLRQGNYAFPEQNANLQFLKIVMGLSILILLLSIVNYINMATANAVKRAKEVGVRKIIGASKNQIIAQFVFETTLITLFSVLLAMVIVELSLPFYNSFLGKNLMLIGTQFYLQLILIFIFVIIVSGVFPAVYISNFETLKVLKGNFSRSKSGVWLRNGMLVLQFSIATLFIIGSFIVYKQVNYMMDKDLGFNGTQVIDIAFRPVKGKIQYNRYKTIKQELSKIKGIEAVSAGVFSIGSNLNSWQGLHYKDNKEVITQQLGLDFGQLDLLGIKIIKGRDLNSKLATDSISNALLNETAAKTLMVKDPLNKEITFGGQKYKVVGIVKDFHYIGVEYNVAPMIFFHIKSVSWMENHLQFISVKISPNGMSETIAEIEKFWKSKVDQEYPFEYGFVNKNFARTYKKYEDQRNLFALLNVVVILIALFGLFALASFSMERRLREIAIRKTLGAETNTLVKELSKQYIFFCIIGFFIGIIPSYILLQKWLENFAFRIDIPLLPFIMAFLSLLIMTLTIVLAKAYQVTKVDVLRYLKYE
jgi:putative ABC transport system permease protein